MILSNQTGFVERLDCTGNDHLTMINTRTKKNEFVSALREASMQHMGTHLFVLIISLLPKKVYWREVN